LPPPPRKVIVETFPQLFPSPPDIIFERWLEYPQRTRRVVYHPPGWSPPLPPKIKNVHIIWDQPEVRVEKNFFNLGIHQANPLTYAARFGPTLVHSSQIPNLSSHINNLHQQEKRHTFRYVGDAHTLRLFREIQMTRQVLYHNGYGIYYKNNINNCFYGLNDRFTNNFTFNSSWAPNFSNNYPQC